MSIGFGCGELGFLGGYLVEDFLLVELGKDLPLLDLGVDVSVEAGDDSGSLGFDLNFGDGLDFTSGDHGSGNIAEFGLSELGGLEFGGVAPGGDRNTECDHDDKGYEACPEPDSSFVLTLCSQGVLQF